MGFSGVQTDTLLQSRKKRSSFTVPSFRRSSAGERQELAKSAEAAACVQKAAAWQWYTRGVGEAVVPTKRPSLGKSLPSQAPILVDGRAASRFKVEARFARRRPTRSAAGPAAPSAGPSTPLYDEVELFGLRTQMADFVQRLQLHQQTKGDQHFAAQNSKPPHTAAVDGHPLPAAASVSSQHIKVPTITAAAAISASSVHQLTKPASPFHMRPFSALHKLFRKLVSRSIIKNTSNSPLTSTATPAVYIEPEVLSEKEEQNSQYHYHHYIHHHHHHYHYGESPPERDSIIRSRRRHSESSDIRRHIPNPWEAESIEEEEEAERSPIEAYLARRRRHSDTFTARLTPKNAAFDEEEEMKQESAKAASPLQMPRRYNSERFSPNKCSAMENKDGKNGGGRDEYFLEIRSRRHSAEYYNREAIGGGKNGGGTYKLSGAGDGAKPAKPLVWRRHSEGLQRSEGVHYEMGKRTPSPLARYLEDMLERQIGASTIANAPPLD